MRVRGVVNSRSGMSIGADPSSLSREIADAFTRSGADCRIECAAPGDVESALRRAIDEKPDILVVGGGDGTMRSAAALVAGKEIALAPIPLGTFNRFARDLRIPLDPAVAAEALAAGHVGRVDVAELNGAVFLCNSMLGLPPDFSARRGALRGKGPLARLWGYAAIVRDFAFSTRKITVTLDDGRAQRRLRALSVIVSNNLYGEEVGATVLRGRLDEGVLGVYASQRESGAGIAMSFLRAMFGRWKSDPSLEYAKAHELTIDTPLHHVKVSTDGEVETLTPPLRYRIRPLALKVVKPAVGRVSSRDKALSPSASNLLGR